MKSVCARLVAIAAMAFTLPACMMLPMGPDLDKGPTPFGEAAAISLVNPAGETTQITHHADGDVMLLKMGEDNTRQTYEGAVTYSRIDAGVDLETAHDHWLIGVNLFRTADRSYYAILRLPENASMASGSSTEAGMMVITCMGLAEIKPKPEPAPGEEPQVEDMLTGSIASMAGCDFTTRQEVLAAAPKLVAAASSRPAEAEAPPTEPDASSQDGDEEAPDVEDLAESYAEAVTALLWEPVSVVVP